MRVKFLFRFRDSDLLPNFLAPETLMKKKGTEVDQAIASATHIPA